MPQTKTQAEPQTKPGPLTSVEKPLESPEKKGGPFMAARSPVASALPPPDGTPPAARAGGVIASIEGGFGAAERARMSQVMQRSVGNARMGEMVGEQQRPTQLSLSSAQREVERRIQSSNDVSLSESPLDSRKRGNVSAEIAGKRSEEIQTPATGRATKAPQTMKDTFNASRGEPATMRTDDRLAISDTSGREGMSSPLDATLVRPGTKSIEQTNASETPPTAMDQNLSRQEQASLASLPGVNAYKSEGGPVVLAPREARQQKAELPTVPMPSTSVPSTLPPPVPQLEPAAREDKRQRAAQEHLTPQTAEILMPEAGSTDDAQLSGQEEALGQATQAEVQEESAPEIVTQSMPESEVVASEEESLQGEEPASIKAVVDEQGEQNQVVAEGPIVGAGAGALIVPPPAPETLKTKIPDRDPTFEEFQEMLVTGGSAEKDRVEVQRLLSDLRATADREKAAILSEAETQKAQIAAEAETQIAALHETVAVHIIAIQRDFTSARMSLIAYVEEQKAVLEGQLTQNLALVEQDTTIHITAVQEQLSLRQFDLTTYAQEQRQRPPEIAYEESDRAAKELEAAAREAEQVGETVAGRYQGSEDPAPDQRAAAREVASESAADIRSKPPDIAADLQSRAADFSGKYMEYADTVNKQLAEAELSLIPAIQDAGSRASIRLQDSNVATLQGMDDRLKVDLASLDAGEASAVAQLRAAGRTAIAQVRSGAQQASGEVDATAAALLAEIDNNVAEVEAIVGKEQNPFVPGIADVVNASNQSIMDTSARGREMLTAGGANTIEMLAGLAASFAEQASSMVGAARISAAQIQEANHTAVNAAAEENAHNTQTILQNLTAEVQSMSDGVLSEVDKAIGEARQKIAGINDDFRGELIKATDESVEEAKRPLTDPLQDRAEEAADEAGDAWYVGLFKAIGDILVGLVILVVVALVVAAIAAAFGVILTAWTAIMIAGAILLTVGVIMSAIQRSSQPELADAPWYKIGGLALSDAIGLTGVIQGVSGKDIVTGKKLSAAERTRQGITGTFSLIMLVLGARAAVKGPPSGMYVRPTGVKPGWVGLAEVLPSAWKGIKSVAAELYTGAKQGVRDLKDWISRRLEGRRSSAANPSAADPTAGRLGIDLADLEPAPGASSGRVLRPRGGKAPADEVSLADRVAAQEGDTIVLTREPNTAAVDGFYRSNGRAVQLKTLSGKDQPTKVVTRANEAYDAAQKFGWRNVDVHIEARSTTTEAVLSRWRQSNRVPVPRNMTDGTIGRVRVHCSDGSVDLPIKTQLAPPILPARPGGETEEEVED